MASFDYFINNRSEYIAWICPKCSRILFCGKGLTNPTGHCCGIKAFHYWDGIEEYFKRFKNKEGYHKLTEMKLMKHE